ncbi:MAG: bifunctional diaminohydroxyphosphoribosylaminopyrimidine deaminase/5-amino-6-(5-phosphoribosylamino)uracil reductase RibD [Candidatus Omnitrophica bacterium]|nr:bifunctional diaminohydroxyphosphoribosylaminopyrimidine deaminase/5-amino-6-(5-phosphoribosylamino)uracil reductase RibD [Candidatus Omnitrophota bacterium]
MIQDEGWMKKAIELAWKGKNLTSPNPLVGALVVKKGKIVSEGYHPFYGGPHAEVVALDKANGQSKGATLYVTLEPCSSWGKTPPCVDQVISSHVTSVVIGSLDPNPLNHKKGIQKLRRAGIRIRTGILAKEVTEQNRTFFKRMQTGYPYITLKMAQSLDGKIATSRGQSRWISSKESRLFVHRLREEVDAILVGKNTALQDNPRLQGLSRNQKPWRVVIDPHLELSAKARIFRGSQLTFVATSEKKLRRNLGKLQQKNRILLPVAEKGGRLEIDSLLKKLAILGVNHLLVEGGGELAWSLIETGLVDRFIWIVAPKIMGGRDAKTSVEGKGVDRVQKALPLTWEKSYLLGEDWVFEARPRRT